MKIILPGLLLLLGVAFQVEAEGLLPFGPTSAEMPRMPEYCKAKFAGPQSPAYQMWEQRIGPKFGGLHHYCAGVNNINRYLYRVSDPKRGYYLSRAVPEINYSASNMPPGFVLAGDMYFNRGKAYQLMGKTAEAIGDYNRAIRSQPNHVLAYLALASLQEKSGNKGEALAVVSEGLRHAPANTALQKKYLSLGGKQPFPEPIERKPAEVEPKAQSQTAEPTDSKIQHTRSPDEQ